MLAARRRAVQAAEKVRLRQTTCRYSTGTHGGTGGEAHHSSSSSTEHSHHHAGPKNESLGTQLYFVLALIPASYGIYLLSQPSKDGTASSISRLIDSYSYYKEKWAARNTLHTSMIEQAAFDRHLFQSDRGSSHINLKFPEIFNTGAPYNVPAGQGGANLERLVAHYEKLNADDEERKAKALATKDLSK